VAVSFFVSYISLYLIQLTDTMEVLATLPASLQARKGVPDAVKIGWSWMGTRKTIAKYIEEHGRKGR
jgi:hypothetical protein